MDAAQDKNFNYTVLGINTATNQTVPLKTNSAGDAVLVEALLMVNDYKVAVSGADTTPAYLSSKIVDSPTVTWTVNNVGGNETYSAEVNTSISGFYQVFQSDAVSETQRTNANFSTMFTLSDNAGNDSTDIDINTLVLGSDATLINTLTSNTDFLTNIATSSVFVDALVGNAYFISTLTSDSTFISDVSTAISGSVAVVTDGVTITGDGTAGDPLTATSLATGVQSVTGLDTDNTDSQNPIVKIAVDGVTIVGEGTPADPLVAVNTYNSINNALVGEDIDGTTTPQAVFVEAFTDNYQTMSGAPANGTYTNYINTSIGSNKLAYKLQLSEDSPINRIDFWGEKNGGINFNFTASIQTESAGLPSGTILTSTTGNEGAWSSGSSGGVSSLIVPKIQLQSGVNYWVVFDFTGISGTGEAGIDTLATGGTGVYRNTGSGYVLVGSSTVTLSVSFVNNFDSTKFYRSSSLTGVYNNPSTPRNKFTGFMNSNTAMDASNGTLITNGVLDGFTGLSVGSKYYVTNAFGEISTSGTVEVGTAISATQLIIKPY